jgi:hypothetical protein
MNGKGKPEAGRTERAKRRGASQHVEGRMPGAKAERAELEPLELWCAGTAQLTSEARAASKASIRGQRLTLSISVLPGIERTRSS